MDHHVDQSSSNIPTHPDELQLAVLRQQNERLIRGIYLLKLNTINTKIN